MIYITYIITKKVFKKTEKNKFIYTIFLKFLFSNIEN